MWVDARERVLALGPPLPAFPGTTCVLPADRHRDPPGGGTVRAGQLLLRRCSSNLLQLRPKDLPYLNLLRNVLEARRLVGLQPDSLHGGALPAGWHHPPIQSPRGLLRAGILV